MQRSVLFTYGPCWFVNIPRHRSNSLKNRMFHRVRAPLLKKKKTSGLLGLCTLNKSLPAAFNSANEGCWFFWFKILNKVCSDVISFALDATQKYHCVFVRVHQPSLSFIIGSWFYNSVRGRGIWKDAAILICLVQQTLDGPKSPWSAQEGAAQNQNKERQQIYKAFSNPLWQMC